MRKRLATNLAVLLAGASLGATMPSIGMASPLDERIGVERFELSRLRRAGRKGTLELAAKKKKKKKKSAASGKDDSSTTPGETDTESSGDTGASDADVQKAARVNPTPAAAPGDDQPVKSKNAKSGVKLEEESAAPRESGPHAPAGRYLDLSVGGQAFSRSLTYHQQITTTLREYQPRLLGDAVLSLLYFPGAQFSEGFVTNIGLELNVEDAFAIQSRTPDGTNYATTIHDFNGGVRVRVPLDSLTPFLTVGYGDHAYKLSGANRPALILPDTEYKYVRAVVGAHVPLAGGVSVAVDAGYRYVLSAGDIKTTYFPHLAVSGIEAGLYVGYALTSLIEARVGFDYRRYFYTMHSRTGDMFIVGGAIDQTYGGSLSLAVTLGGADHPSSSSAASSSSEEAPPPPPASDSGDATPKRKKAKRPKMEDGAAGE